MRERTLHYIWENRLYDTVTLDGATVSVLDVGQYNIGDGPDFLVAKVQIGDIVWAGAVEMHLRASDWQRHHHETDPRYSSVVLHVVLQDDAPGDTVDATGRAVPTALLSVDEEVVRRIEQLELSDQALRCTPELSYVGTDRFRALVPGLLRERMHQKLEKRTGTTAGTYSNTFFYHALMRYLGAHQNNDVMEQVARSLPYTYLKKHASDPAALEAMLLGQAGQISSEPRDSYEAELGKEYAFYREKFALEPLPPGVFRKLRVRPPSYPARMLAIAAQIIHREDELRTALVNQDYTTLTSLLSHPPSEYWQTHIDFGQPTKRRMGGPGQATVLTLLINAILPTAYLYAKSIGHEAMAQAALDHLGELPPERNRIVRLFEQNGITPVSTADTQAMLQLYEHYCTPYRCLSCPVAPLIFEYFRTRHQ